MKQPILNTCGCSAMSRALALFWMLSEGGVGDSLPILYPFFPSNHPESRITILRILRIRIWHVHYNFSVAEYRLRSTIFTFLSFGHCEHPKFASSHTRAAFFFFYLTSFDFILMISIIFHPWLHLLSHWLLDFGVSVSL